MAVVDLQRAQAAQDRLVEILAGQATVNGIGLVRTSDGYALRVNLRTNSGRAGVPAEVDGVTVQVKTIGPIRKRRAA